MRGENREVIIPERVIPEYKVIKQIWIADDGTEFDDIVKCSEYEQLLYVKRIMDSSPNVVVCLDLNDKIPFDGGEYNTDAYNYVWFKILNESGREELKKAYPGLYQVDQIPVGKWCILESETHGDAYWSRVTDGLMYIKRILNALNDVDPGVIDKVRMGEDI